MTCTTSVVMWFNEAKMSIMVEWAYRCLARQQCGTTPLQKDLTASARSLYGMRNTEHRHAWLSHVAAHLITMKKLTELQVATKPWGSSMSPSSAPALLAATQPVMQLSLLCELRAWSCTSGAPRRTCTVCSLMPCKECPCSHQVSARNVLPGIQTAASYQIPEKGSGWRLPALLHLSMTCTAMCAQNDKGHVSTCAICSGVRDRQERAPALWAPWTPPSTQAGSQQWGCQS